MTSKIFTSCSECKLPLFLLKIEDCNYCHHKFKHNVIRLCCEHTVFDLVERHYWRKYGYDIREALGYSLLSILLVSLLGEGKIEVKIVRIRKDDPAVAYMYFAEIMPPCLYCAFKYICRERCPIAERHFTLTRCIKGLMATIAPIDFYFITLAESLTQE